MRRLILPLCLMTICVCWSALDRAERERAEADRNWRLIRCQIACGTQFEACLKRAHGACYQDHADCECACP